MQRLTAAIVGAFLLVTIGALVLKGGRRSLLTDGPGDAGARESREARNGVDSGVLEDPLFAIDLEADAGAHAAPSSSGTEPAALLPSGSPKMVRFGVILVQYRGAEGSTITSRSKDEALVYARSIAQAARSDFKSQVLKGDPGSMEDAGRIPRGVLEPAAEYVLFTLAQGNVSEPLDTPRGYWIVKRIE
jgi:hypothetical protein